MTTIYLITAFIKDIIIIMMCVLVLGYITGRIDQQYTPSRTAFIESETECHTDTECEEQEDYLNAHNIYRM